METMQHIDDLAEENVRTFPGFLSVLLYDGFDDTMEKFLREKWNSLNQWSGGSLLILVPRLVVNGEVRANDELAAILSDRFEVALKDFPSLVFFNGTASTAGEVFSFSKDEALAEIFKHLFSHRIAVRGSYSSQLQNLASLDAVRENMLNTLRPRLTTDKIIRWLRTITRSNTLYISAANVGISAAKGIAGLGG